MPFADGAPTNVEMSAALRADSMDRIQRAKRLGEMLSLSPQEVVHLSLRHNEKELRRLELAHSEAGRQQLAEFWKVFDDDD